MSYLRDFRTQVRAYRERRGWTQAELAEELGWTPSRVAQIEAGYLPSAELAYKLAMVCGMDPGEVCTWVAAERLGRPAEQMLHVRNSTELLTAMKNARSRLWICGITSIRRVRNVRDGLSDLLAAGGQLRVALLDPGSEAFRRRRRKESVGGDECLPEGLITLRMDHEAHVVMEILKAMHWKARQVGKADEMVRLRLYDGDPEASITIVDATVAQRGEYRKEHMGARPPVFVYWDPAHEGFRRTVEDFEAVWDRAEEVSLDDLAEDTVSLASDWRSFVDSETWMRRDN